MLVLKYSLSVCTYILCLIQVLYSCIHSNWPQMKGESDFYKKTVSLDLHWNNYVLWSALLHPSYLIPLYMQRLSNVFKHLIPPSSFWLPSPPPSCNLPFQDRDILQGSTFLCWRTAKGLSNYNNILFWQHHFWDIFKQKFSYHILDTISGRESDGSPQRHVGETSFLLFFK